MLAQLHRRHSGDRVRVVGRRNGHRIDALPFFLQQHAKVLEPLRERERLERTCRLAIIDVAERIDVLGLAHAPYVIGAHPTDTDARNVELVTRRKAIAAARAKHVGRHDRKGEPRGHVTDEAAPGNVFAAHGSIRILMLRKRFSRGALAEKVK